jgi:hypothetical protein
MNLRERMKYRTWTAVLFVVLVPGLLGCDKSDRSPMAPSEGSVLAPTTPTPAGAMFLKGTVSDTAYRPLAGAVVQVLDGPQAGVSATADARGDFAMAGVFDEATRFRATAEGHVPAISTLQPFCAGCTPNWWIHFALDLPSSRVDVGGDYTLTFVANNTCTMIPDDMRSRTFTATIPVTSSALPADAFFRVSGATFFEDWNAIAIGVAGNYVALWLETLVEQIAPNTFLAFAGGAAGTVDSSNPSTFVLPFHGSIEYCVTTAENGRYPNCHQAQATARRCESSHLLTLTRR